MIKLILPSLELKKQILDYKSEFVENNESMDGTAGLQNDISFEEWYEAYKDNLNEDTVREGLVPATTFIAVDSENLIVGMIDVRHRLNEYLIQFGGHIGYSIRKSKRRKGYATKMLELALYECKKLKIDKVLITCDKENLASVKTIINNGGILENEVLENKRITQRYWVDLLGSKEE